MNWNVRTKQQQRYSLIKTTASYTCSSLLFVADFKASDRSVQTKVLPIYFVWKSCRLVAGDRVADVGPRGKATTSARWLVAGWNGHYCRPHADGARRCGRTWLADLRQRRVRTTRRLSTGNTGYTLIHILFTPYILWMCRLVERNKSMAVFLSSSSSQLWTSSLPLLCQTSSSAMAGRPRELVDFIGVGHFKAKF